MEFIGKASDFEAFREYIESSLKKENVSRRKIDEAMLVFEAIYDDLMAQGLSADSDLSINIRKSLGETIIRLGYEGELIEPRCEVEDDDAPEQLVLKAYADKISHSYHSGYNNFTITVKRNHSRSYNLCMIATVLAIATYGIIKLCNSPAAETYILEEIVLPFETLFTNAVLMIAAPVTFFSLIKNLTDAYIVAERSSTMRQLRSGTIISSLISIGLGIITGTLLIMANSGMGRLMAEYDSIKIDVTIGDILESLLPNSIFAPFESVAPFPLIILAVLVTYAFCSTGHYFDKLKTAVDAAYRLFVRMLNIVMFTLPFFCFTAILDITLRNGLNYLLGAVFLMVIVILSLFVLVLYYWMRLKIAKIDTKDFFSKLPKLLSENLLIQSSIEAVPYNIRYCTLKYGMDRKKLEDAMPVLAQINLDGNCFIFILLTLIFLFMSGASVSWFNLVVIVLLVLFLSLGAPNQPGTLIIGLMIITAYLNMDNALPLTIYTEVLLGSILNLVNVIGDIVTVATLDASDKKDAVKT